MPRPRERRGELREVLRGVLRLLRTYRSHEVVLPLESALAESGHGIDGPKQSRRAKGPALYCIDASQAAARVRAGLRSDEYAANLEFARLGPSLPIVPICVGALHSCGAANHARPADRYGFDGVDGITPPRLPPEGAAPTPGRARAAWPFPRPPSPASRCRLSSRRPRPRLPDRCAVART